MNKSDFSLIILLAFACVEGRAQTIYGKVIETETNSAIPYVNIGILQRGIGTVSNLNGAFELKISKSMPDDSIKISCIGYLPKQFVLRDFKKQFGITGFFEISLMPQVIELREVTINSTPRKHLVFGHQPKSRLTKAGFTVKRLGHEIGTLFDHKILPCYYWTVYNSTLFHVPTILYLFV